MKLRRVCIDFISILESDAHFRVRRIQEILTKALLRDEIKNNVQNNGHDDTREAKSVLTKVANQIE